MEKAIQLLSRREYCRNGLKQKLLGCASESVVNEVLSVLEHRQLVSDERFVEVAVRHYAEKCYGPCYIYEKLTAQGVAQEIVCNSLGKYKNQWQELARKQRIKHFGSERCTDLKECWKQKQYLKRRGFLVDDIESAF